MLPATRRSRLTALTIACLTAATLAAAPAVPSAPATRVEQGSFDDLAPSASALLEQLAQHGPSVELLGVQVAEGLAWSLGGAVLHPVWPEGATGIEVTTAGLGHDRSGDGVDEVLAVAYDHDTETVTEYVLDGEDGTVLFEEPVVYHPDVDAPHDYVVAVTDDVTGDGIPDLLRALLVEYDESDPCITGNCHVTTEWVLQLVSGADGTLLWSDTWQGRYDDTTDADGNRRFEHEDYRPLATPFHDVDGDGVDEIALVGGTSGWQYDGQYPTPFGSAHAEVVDATGTVLDTFATAESLGSPELHPIGDVVGGASVDYAWVRRGWEYVQRTTCPVPDVAGLLELLDVCDTWTELDASVIIETVDGAALDVAWETSVVTQVTSLSDPTVHTDHDLTGDGANDIVAVSPGVGGSEVDVFDGRTGELVWAFPYPDRWLGLHQIADFDGDGDLDVIVDGGQWSLTFSNDPEIDGTVRTVYTHVAIDGQTADVLSETEHLRRPPGSPSFATAAAPHAGDLDGDGLIDPIHNVSFGYDNGDGTTTWDTEARVLDGADPEAVLLDRTGPGYRRWRLSGDVDRDGTHEVIEFDHGHDRAAAPTAIAVTDSGTELWRLPDAAGTSLLGSDLLQGRVSIDGNHRDSTVILRTGGDLVPRWSWRPAPPG